MKWMIIGLGLILMVLALVGVFEQQEAVISDSYKSSASPSLNKRKADVKQHSKNPFALVTTGQDSGATVVQQVSEKVAQSDSQAEHQTVLQSTNTELKDKPGTLVKKEASLEYSVEVPASDSKQRVKINIEQARKHWPQVIISWIDEHLVQYDLTAGKDVNYMLASKKIGLSPIENEIQTYLKQTAVTYGIEAYSAVCREQWCMLSVLQQQDFAFNNIESGATLERDIARRFGFRLSHGVGLLGATETNNLLSIQFFVIKQ